ncbi:hypothetical protein Tco_1364116 [Tanacetum coccineum]
MRREKKVEEEKDANERAREEQAMDAQDGKVQAEAYVPEPQVKKPQLLSSSLTLSSTEYGNQLINDNPDVSLTDVLKEPVEAEVQSMVEVPVLQENLIIQRISLVNTTLTLLPEATTHSPKQQPQKRSKTKIILKKSKKPEEKVDVVVVLQRLIKLEKMVATISKIDHIEAIEESVQGNVTNEVKNQLSKFIPKAVSEFVQPRMESMVHDVLKTTLITLYQTPSTFADSLTEYELKLKLYNMMQNSHSFLYHEKHLTLDNALINSMDVDEANIQGNKHTNKRRHDKQDPPADADKDSKKRKRKDADTSSSKKGKTQSKSSKEAKALTKPLATYKAIEDEELIQDNVEDDDEMLQDDDMAVDDMPHDDDALTQEWSKWFKQDAVVRLETSDPEWYKELIADDARLMIS